jgi:glycosyltransferase involved in cell wall biosynthesis
MSLQVIQVDISQPLQPIATSRRHGALWIVVRYGIRPIGMFRVRRNHVGEVFAPDMQRAMISESLGLQVHDVLRNRTFDLPQHTPSASVVVCTREHPDVLERQLNSLRWLDYPDHEVIVVDNAPRSDRTRRVCERFDFVKYVHEPRPGLDFARNTGWRAARGEVIAYTDDDAAVDKYWLRALAAHYVDPRVWCVTGITFPLELETAAQLHFERYGGMQRGFARRVYKPGTWSAFYPLGAGRFGAGVNLSLRRSALESMGGFDNALDVGSLARGCGDLDIMARVVRDGGWLVYEPCAVVWHQHRRTKGQLRKQMFDYGWGFCAYVNKYTRDLELGNQSLRMLKRWSRVWGKNRLLENVGLALRMRPHFPIDLILLEILGGVLGYGAYKRSVRRARMIDQKFSQPPAMAEVAA